MSHNTKPLDVVGTSSFAGTLKGVTAKYHGEMKRVQGGYEEGPCELEDVLEVVLLFTSCLLQCL